VIWQIDKHRNSAAEVCRVRTIMAVDAFRRLVADYFTIIFEADAL